MKDLAVLLVGGSGYVGSFIHDSLTRSGYQVDVCDRGDRGFIDGIPVKFPFDASELSPELLRGYDHVLWFAGVSNVKQAVANPVEALQDNLMTLAKIAAGKRDGAHLTYASSASLYSGTTLTAGLNATESDTRGPFSNPYDLSKYLFDLTAETLFAGTTGLRMGTVCGFSQQLRKELIFNAMCLSGVRNGSIDVSNGSAHRTILFLDHLSRVVLAILGSKELQQHRTLNVGSLNASIESLGDAIAAVLGCQVKKYPDEGTYSFTMNHSVLEAHGLGFEDSLESQVEKFVREARGYVT